MAEYLVIRLQSGDDLASWIAVDDTGARRSPPVSGPLAEAAGDVGDRNVIVLLPAADVLTVTIDLPARGARLLAALPFALEDQVADDVEDLHFAPGKRLPNGRLPVAVISHERMQHWLERLSAADIRPARIVAENQGLAIIPNTMSLLVSGERLMFNNGLDTEFAVEQLTPLDLVAASGAMQTETAEDEQPPSRHLLVYCEPADEDRYHRDWNALRDELDGVDINLLPDGVLPRLAVTVASGAGVDLLAGPYGEKAEMSKLFLPWRRAAILLLALFVAGIAGKGVDYYRLLGEEAELKAQFITEYREIRPNDTREVVDPVGTVRSLQRSLGGPAGAAPVFLPSLQQLSRALAQNRSAEVEQISYRAGVVNISLTAPDVTTLDRIQQLVSESARFTAEIKSTVQDGDRINSRIEITEEGA